MLPLLHRLAEATRGTEYELSVLGLLATALRRAGRPQEAEAMLHAILDQAEARGFPPGGCRSNGARLSAAGGRAGRAGAGSGRPDEGPHPPRRPGALDAVPR